MDKKPKQPKKIRVVKSVLDDSEHVFYKDGKQIGKLKFSKTPDRISLKFDWEDEEEKDN
jgi:hypothetical protein